VSGITDWIHELTGKLGQEPVGAIPYVGVLKDNYLPPLYYEGCAGAGVGAAAGFRSEVALIVQGNRVTGEAVYIPRIWVLLGATGNVQVITRTTITGFTDVPVFSGDPRAGLGRLRILTKNSAAATAGGISVVGAPTIFGVYTELPVRTLLRIGDINGGNLLLIRPDTDNISCYVIAEYEQREKRSL